MKAEIMLHRKAFRWCSLGFIYGLLMLSGGFTEVVISPLSANVTENDPFTLTCTFKGTDTVKHYSWYVQKTTYAGPVTIGILTLSCETVIINVNTTLYSFTCPNSRQSTWTVKNVTRQNDGDKFACNIETDTGNENSMKSVLKVDVSVSSVSMIAPSASIITVRENREVVFKCRTSASRPAANVTWYKDSGTSGQSSDDIKISSNITTSSNSINDLTEVTSTLRYAPTRNENGWVIYCAARNIVGRTPVLSLRKPELNVQYPPDGSPVITGYSDGSIYRVIENTQGRISCSVTGGNPLPTLTWDCFNNGIKETDSNGTATKIHSWTAERGQDKTCTCIASHYSGDRTVSIKIETLYHPTEPTFKIKTTTVSETIKIIKNNHLSVSCSSSGNPTPSYTWIYPTLSTSSGSELNVYSVQNSGQYTCDVQNIMHPSASAVVHGSNTSSVDVLLLYPPIIREFENISVVEGFPVTVSCNATVGYPSETTYEWRRNKTILSRTREFTIDAATRSDAMFYTCTASNIMLQTGENPVTQPDSKSFNLNIWYSTSIVSFFVDGFRGQTDVTVDENDGNIQFICEVDSNPASYVKIAFDGMIVKEESNTKDVSIIYSSVSCLDSGQYICEGNNQYEQVAKQVINLFVNCSPRSLYQMRQNISTALNVPVTLSFTALAHPQPGPKGFVWFKEEGTTRTPVLGNADWRLSSSALQSNLTILNVSKEDFGHYTVNVTNELGSFVQHIYLIEDKAEEKETCPRYCRMETDNTTVTMGISLGLIIVVLGIYAASITILYKRRNISKVTKPDNRESTQKTYVNIAYKPNITENKNDQNSSIGSDVANGAGGNDAQHYTDLDEYSRDDRTAYEVLNAH